MAYQTLYLKYRSQTFADLVGQDPIAKTLKNAVEQGRVAHAYLFSGVRGTGKTSTARILAKAINCLNRSGAEPCGVCAACVEVGTGAAVDLIEIDAASNRGIDEIRELRERVKYLPASLKVKVYIIDEAHMLTPEAFNALLKTLEEPPVHVMFVLATTEPHKIPLTVASRCQRFDFRRIETPALAARLAMIVEAEGVQVDPAALALLRQKGLALLQGYRDGSIGLPHGEDHAHLLQSMCLAVDDSVPYRAFVEPGRFRKGERVQAVAVLRDLQGKTGVSKVLSFTPRR